MIPDIREIQKSELEDLLDLYSHLHVSDAPRPTAEKIEDTWREICRSDYLFCFGAFLEGGRLVSSCTITIIPNLTRGCRPYAVIENVVTHMDHRRKGYAKRLLRHALEKAWQRDCYKAMLLTGRKDEKVFRFYESVGFDRHAKQAFVLSRLS